MWCTAEAWRFQILGRREALRPVRVFFDLAFSRLIPSQKGFYLQFRMSRWSIRNHEFGRRGNTYDDREYVTITEITHFFHPGAETGMLYGLIVCFAARTCFWSFFLNRDCIPPKSRRIANRHSRFKSSQARNLLQLHIDNTFKELILITTERQQPYLLINTAPVNTFPLPLPLSALSFTK